MWLVVSVQSSSLIDRALPLSDPAQPWPICISAGLFDDLTAAPKQSIDLRIRAMGRPVSAAATAIHGISARDADRCGVPEVVAVGALVCLAADAEGVVGFGLDHHRDVVTSSLLRAKPEPRPTTRWLRPGMRFIDLIKPAAAFCKIEGEHESGSYRWPSLEKAAEMMLDDHEIEAPMTSCQDMEIAALIFAKLKAENMIDLGPKTEGPWK